jgi:hypothetical protein
VRHEGHGRDGESEASDRPDVNDVTYDGFLANDRTLADPEVVKVELGRRVLLRVINGSAMSVYHFDLGRLDGRLIAVEGTLVVCGRCSRISGSIRL